MYMINEKNIAHALALSISQVGYNGDDRLYLYEVNQVLNRYKTNLYKLMDESKSNIDPATIIQFVLRSSVDIGGSGNIQDIMHVNQSTLKVYGTRAYGPEVFVEYKPFQYTIDVSKEFYAPSIAGVRTDLFSPDLNWQKRPAHVTCLNAMIEHPDTLESRMSISFQLSKVNNTEGNLSIVMSGVIFPEVLEMGRRKCALMFDSGEPKRAQKQRKPDAYYQNV